MDGISIVVMVAVIVEAIIEYAKTIGKMFVDGNHKTAVTQLAAVALAIGLCFITNANLFEVIGIDFSYNWVGIVLTGIFGSRGANYVSDFISRLKGKITQEEG